MACRRCWPAGARLSRVQRGQRVLEHHLHAFAQLAQPGALRLGDVLVHQPRPSIVAAGIDPKTLEGKVTPERARELFSEHGLEAHGPTRWVDIWSAGHSVSGVDAVQPVAALVEQLAQEYAAAKAQTRATD